MKHSKVIVVGLLAAGIVLAGCSSKKDDAANNGSPSDKVSESVGSSPAASSGPASGSVDSSPAASSGPASASVSGPAEGSSKADPSSKADEPVAPVGSFDEQTTQWFTVMCGGLEPLMTSMSEIPNESTDKEQALKKMGEVMAKGGTAMVDTSKKLAAMPAPKVTGGEELAKSTLAAYEKSSKDLIEFGKKASEATGADQAAVAASLEPVLVPIDTEIKKVITQAKAGNYFDSMTQIPACQKVTTVVAGG